MGAFDVFVANLGGATAACVGIAFSLSVGVRLSAAVRGECERWRGVFRRVLSC